MTEYANTEFWKLYQEYVDECLPRHQKVVSKFTSEMEVDHNKWLVDFGCGWAQESKRLLPEYKIFTVDADLNARPDVCGDYREMDLQSLNGICPRGFVSLFSTELTAPPASNEAFYEKLFGLIPTLRFGLVSGFYYRGRENESWVAEVGGLISWQSSLQLGNSPHYKESKIVIEAPSNLFGPSVVEVWKLLERRNYGR